VVNHGQAPAGFRVFEVLSRDSVASSKYSKLDESKRLIMTESFYTLSFICRTSAYGAYFSSPLTRSRE
jgi:hypothetical protein